MTSPRRRWLLRFLGLWFGGLVLLAPRALVADESTWTAPPARVQVARDPVLIPQGKGLLFVPAMSVPKDNEPSYIVLHNGQRVGSASPGRGVLVEPGIYEVVVGSGAISQRQRISRVQVREGHTTLMDADWAALVIDVIDEGRVSINESYEIYQEETQENMGLGFGVEEERGERVRTWILKPGVYHVVGVGESYSTIRKYSVRLMAGELTQRNLVFNEDTGDIRGFYPTPGRQYGGAEVVSNITSQTEISGSTLLATSQNTPTDDPTSLFLSLQIFNRMRYSTDRNFASVRVVLEEGATKAGGDDFRKSVDRLEMRATYIYRLSRKFGPYMRGVVKTELFERDFDHRDSVFVKLNARGDTLEQIVGPSSVRLEPSFFPLEFREGIGINSQLFRTFRLNMDLRFGLGARQTLVSDTFSLESDSRGFFGVKRKTSTSRGLEALLILDSRLAKSVNLDSEFDILINERDPGAWVFSFENRLRIFLSSFVNLDLVADIERQEGLQRITGSEQYLLRFSRFF